MSNTLSKKHAVIVSSSKSATQQAKQKSIWVQKGRVASEDFTNSTSIVVALGDQEKPFSEPFAKSNLASPEASLSEKPPSPESPPILKPILSCSKTRHNKTNYNVVKKGALPLYIVPKHIQKLIKRNIVPQVLRMPLSPLTYKDYFATLLYAEDYYFEKWDGFEMLNVSMEKVNLEFDKAVIHQRNGKFKSLYRSDEEDVRTFVKFEIDSIPEKRPFLLSKDFAYLRQSGTEDTPFKGIIFRVEKSKHLMVEFGKEFYDQHYSECKYDVKFSLNRVCLKRAHRAIEAASDVIFKNFLFPGCIPTSNNVSFKELQLFHPTLKEEQVCAVHRIVMHQGPSPYLVEGPLSVTRVRKTKRGEFKEERLTSTGNVVQEAVLQLWKTSPLNQMLICAHSNSACDVLTRNLLKEIPVSDIFRSNAAFRELDEVPDDILPHCPYKAKEELFPCPQLVELKKFRIIISTFMSASRLHQEGLKAGHFSHIFLVDASSVIEPETLVPLANLANEKTVIVVGGKLGNFSRWVRSKIARDNGLQTSFFERLRKSNLYETLDPQAISQLSMKHSTYP